MKSKANFKTHPLHPILIVFPFSFFTGTLIFDVLSKIFDSEAFGQTALYLNIAGIIGALVAAVPGIIDFFYTVPPKSSAKKRAAKHGLINVSVLVIFIIILLLRNNSAMVIPGLGILLLDIAAVTLLFIAGWMGGTLVHRNQIGVDIRYANAGKWKEAYFNTSEKSIEIGGAGELQLNQMKLIHLNDKRIVVGKTEKGYVAFDDHCTHKGGSLAAGAMICGTVQCPWHGSQFDVYTGVATAGPAKESIPTYTINETGGKLFLEL